MSEPINKRHARYIQWRDTDHGQRVFPYFERAALRLASEGRSFGINLLREKFRDEVRAAVGVDDEGYKFCNTHSPYIARELIERYPQLKDNIRIKAVEGETHA